MPPRKAAATATVAPRAKRGAAATVPAKAGPSTVATAPESDKSSSTVRSDSPPPVSRIAKAETSAGAKELAKKKAEGSKTSAGGINAAPVPGLGPNGLENANGYGAFSEGEQEWAEVLKMNYNEDRNSAGDKAAENAKLYSAGIKNIQVSVVLLGSKPSSHLAR